mmetsp:Transcript_26512/g.68125  ORF Transcript_26512/g.68125 Transcript_26512/m.68125 type:complete len:207 (-) Transcript_26512:221-841(-)
MLRCVGGELNLHDRRLGGKDSAVCKGSVVQRARQLRQAGPGAVGSRARKHTHKVKVLLHIQAGELEAQAVREAQASCCGSEHPAARQVGRVNVRGGAAIGDAANGADKAQLASAALGGRGAHGAREVRLVVGGPKAVAEGALRARGGHEDDLERRLLRGDGVIPEHVDVIGPRNHRQRLPPAAANAELVHQHAVCAVVSDVKVAEV